MRIIGPSSAGRGAMLRLLLDPARRPADVAPRFVEGMFDPLWEEALRYGIDPVGVVAQSAHETGWGTFARNAQPWMRNTCGLRVEDLRKVSAYLAALGSTDGEHPLTHAQFPSWRMGARAQVQHLCAYAGQPVDPDEVVDPRYLFVAGRHWCEDFEELGGPGRWAPDPEYGVRVADIAQRLREGAA